MLDVKRVRQDVEVKGEEIEKEERKMGPVASESNLLLDWTIILEILLKIKAAFTVIVISLFISYNCLRLCVSRVRARACVYVHLPTLLESLPLVYLETVPWINAQSRGAIGTIK